MITKQQFERFNQHFTVREIEDIYNYIKQHKQGGQP